MSKSFLISKRDSQGDFAIIEKSTNKEIRLGKTMRDAINIAANLEANLPATFLGFGTEDTPRFFLEAVD